jgi:hypothetical protein
MRTFIKEMSGLDYLMKLTNLNNTETDSWHCVPNARRQDVCGTIYKTLLQKEENPVYRSTRS